jgi:transposase
MRYELADHVWAAIKPMLPNKPRGVPRVNDRRVLKASFRQQSEVNGLAAPVFGK